MSQEHCRISISLARRSKGVAKPSPGWTCSNSLKTVLVSLKIFINNKFNSRSKILNNLSFLKTLSRDYKLNPKTESNNKSTSD